MQRFARSLFFLSVSVWLLSLFAPLTSPAYAEISGNCGATFKGVDVAGLGTSSADDAIDVDGDEVVVVTMTSAAGFASHEVKLEIAGVSRTVSSQTDDGDTQWSETVKVKDYAWMGAGLYKVVGSATLSDGSTCSGAALINVTRNPLTTVAGGAATAATVVGAVGLIGSSAVASRNGAKASRKVEDWIADELEKVANEPPPPSPEAAGSRSISEEQAWIETIDLFGAPFGIRMPCAMFVLPALILTGVAMAVPAGEGGPPPARALTLRRASFLPRLTVAGIGGGVLAGLGIVVLLQQFGVTPLTGTLAIAGLVGGLIIGILLPSLFNLLAVMRVNRAIAAGESRLAAAINRSGPAAQAPGAEPQP
jgi:hypothetical protein